MNGEFDEFDTPLCRASVEYKGGDDDDDDDLRVQQKG
jgi:hypothetical protein